ncbi:HAMP domain-containing protein [Pseudanabaenaceae cyanobacterium LEGE 13415]|nr:HAMP domain-containing protein [Pseudanabaenaceae cyanobacterium LEGE 13415]
MKHPRLSTVLIVAFIVQIASTVGLVSYFSYRNSQRSVHDLATQLMNEKSDRIQTYLKTYTETPPLVTQLNTNAIQSGYLQLNTLNRWNVYLFQQSQQFETLAYVYFGSTQGEYVEFRSFGDRQFKYSDRQGNKLQPVKIFDTNTQGKPERFNSHRVFDPRTRPWYKTAIQTGQPTWTNIYTFTDNPPTLGISFVRPYYKNQQLRGVLGADFVLPGINDFLKQIQPNEASRVFIIERNGKLVASSTNQSPFDNKRQRLNAISLSDPLIRSTAQQLQQSFSNLEAIRDRQELEFDFNQHSHIVEVTPVTDAYGLDWLIVLVTPQSSFMARIEANNRTTAILSLIALVASVVTSTLLARWLSRPVKRLSDASQDMAKGNYEQAVTIRGSQEIVKLARSFNLMSQEIQRSHQELEEYARSLEAKVKERTQQLEQEVEERQRTNAELEAVFSAMDQLIFVFDREGRHLKIPASRATHILYKPLEGRIGRTLHDVFPQDIADHFLKHIWQALETRSTIDIEYTLNVEGHQIWSDASISPIDDKTVIWVSRDVTDRKHAEQQLKQSHDELKQTLDELRSTQAKLIESEKLAALGQLVAGVAHEMNTPLGAMRSSIETVSHFMEHDLEALQTLPLNYQKDFSALMHRSNETAPTLSQLSSREKRQLKRALTRELDQHQISPADSIADTLIDIGVIDRIEPFLALLKDPNRDVILTTAYQFTSVQRSVQTLSIASNQAAHVVRALKTYARQNAETKPVKASVIDGIETALTLYRNQLKRGVEVIQHYDDVPAIECYADELNQVWMNLIHNAIQAMNYQGQLTIAVHSEIDQIKVEITDTGAGIPPEIQARIFSPFFTTKPMGEGNGLGLSIVQQVIDKHHGSIRFETVPGHTVFRVSLPISLDS